MDSDGDALAVPALFIIDPAGAIRFRKVGEHLDDRAYIGDVLSTLTEISAQQPR